MFVNRPAALLVAVFAVFGCDAGSLGIGDPSRDAGGAGLDAGGAPADGPAGATDGGGGDAGGPSNEVRGTIKGHPFPVARAYWIGQPDPGSAPTNIYLVEPSLSCADIGSPGWDKPLGNGQVLEMNLDGDSARTYTIGRDATANYLRAASNPDADAGTITIRAIRPATDMTGGFELTFGKDAIRGDFVAVYCDTGVEP